MISFENDMLCSTTRIMDNYFETEMLTKLIPKLAKNEVYLRGNYCPDYKTTSTMSRYDTPSQELITALENGDI